MKGLRVGAINYGIRRVEGVFNKIMETEEFKRTYLRFQPNVRARLESAGNQGVNFG